MEIGSVILQVEGATDSAPLEEMFTFCQSTPAILTTPRDGAAEKRWPMGYEASGAKLEGPLVALSTFRRTASPGYPQPLSSRYHDTIDLEGVQNSCAGS